MRTATTERTTKDTTEKTPFTPAEDRELVRAAKSALSRARDQQAALVAQRAAREAQLGEVQDQIANALAEGGRADREALMDILRLIEGDKAELKSFERAIIELDQRYAAALRAAQNELADELEAALRPEITKLEAEIVRARLRNDRVQHLQNLAADLLPGSIATSRCLLGNQYAGLTDTPSASRFDDWRRTVARHLA